MERFILPSILPLLICTNLVTAPFSVTRREKGDRFVWSGSGRTINCAIFTRGTAWYHDDACECNTDLLDNPGTFSTQSNKCEYYVDEGEEAITTGMMG